MAAQTLPKVTILTVPDKIWEWVGNDAKKFLLAEVCWHRGAHLCHHILSMTQQLQANMLILSKIFVQLDFSLIKLCLLWLAQRSAL